MKEQPRRIIVERDGLRLQQSAGPNAYLEVVKIADASEVVSTPCVVTEPKDEIIRLLFAAWLELAEPAAPAGVDRTTLAPQKMEFVSELWLSVRQVEHEPESWLRKELLTTVDAFEQATGRRCDVLRIRGAERLPIESERPAAPVRETTQECPNCQSPGGPLLVPKDGDPERCRDPWHNAAPAAPEITRLVEQLREAEKRVDAMWVAIPDLLVKAKIMLEFPDGLDPVRLTLRESADAISRLSRPPQPWTREQVLDELDRSGYIMQHGNGETVRAIPIEKAADVIVAYAALLPQTGEPT